MSVPASIDKNDDRRVKGNLGKCAAVGIKTEDSQKAYAAWAENYEKDLKKLNSIAHTLVANSIKECFPEDKQQTVTILDVGAGTGRVAKELRAAGFKKIDALEPCAKMLDVAKRDNLYNTYYIDFLTEKPVANISENSYDAITGSGIYGEGGHVSVGAIYEMIRIVKPGGYIALSTRQKLFETIPEYKDMEPTIEKLVTEGRVKKLKHDKNGYLYSDRRAVSLLFQVL